MNSLTKADVRDQLSNIDQIRDILFGSQLREHGNRLEQIETSLSVLQQEVRDRTEEVKQVLSTELQASVEGLEKKIKTFTLKDNDEKVDIRQQIDRLNGRLSNNIESLDEAIDQQTTSLRDDFLSSREKLQEDILSLRNQIFEELERRVSILTETKIARDDMAEMLFELGLRLKGTEFVPELKEAAGSQELVNKRYVLEDSQG
ncbi:MAG: hypothetical protein F6K19_13640 [Cyanothece sp. SIO1E1]|nr:hypothetical protein [Cyanothece sp. SIO1E1]